MTFSLLTLAISNGISAVFWGVAGYYICHRGTQGVVSDLADARQDVKNLIQKKQANVVVVKTPV